MNQGTQNTRLSPDSLLSTDKEFFDVVKKYLFEPIGHLSEGEGHITIDLSSEENDTVSTIPSRISRETGELAFPFRFNGKEYTNIGFPLSFLIAARLDSLKEESSESDKISTILTLLRLHSMRTYQWMHGLPVYPPILPFEHPSIYIFASTSRFVSSMYNIKHLPKASNFVIDAIESFFPKLQEHVPSSPNRAEFVRKASYDAFERMLNGNLFEKSTIQQLAEMSNKREADYKSKGILFPCPDDPSQTSEMVPPRDPLRSRREYTRIMFKFTDLFTVENMVTGRSHVLPGELHVVTFIDEDYFLILSFNLCQKPEYFLNFEVNLTGKQGLKFFDTRKFPVVIQDESLSAELNEITLTPVMEHACSLFDVIPYLDSLDIPGTTIDTLKNMISKRSEFLYGFTDIDGEICIRTAIKEKGGDTIDITKATKIESRIFAIPSEKTSKNPNEDATNEKQAFYKKFIEAITTPVLTKIPTPNLPGTNGHTNTTTTTSSTTANETAFDLTKKQETKRAPPPPPQKPNGSVVVSPEIKAIKKQSQPVTTTSSSKKHKTGQDTSPDECSYCKKAGMSILLCDFVKEKGVCNNGVCINCLNDFIGKHKEKYPSFANKYKCFKDAENAAEFFCPACTDSIAARARKQTKPNTKATTRSDLCGECNKIGSISNNPTGMYNCPSCRRVYHRKCNVPSGKGDSILCTYCTGKAIESDGSLFETPPHTPKNVKSQTEEPNTSTTQQQKRRKILRDEEEEEEEEEELK